MNRKTRLTILLIILALTLIIVNNKMYKINNLNKETMPNNTSNLDLVSSQNMDTKDASNTNTGANTNQNTDIDNTGANTNQNTDIDNTGANTNQNADIDNTTNTNQNPDTPQNTTPNLTTIKYKNVKYIGFYSRGLIYITTNKSEAEEFRKIKNEEDVIILDQRAIKNDPNIKLVDSYKITDKDDMEKIIDVIMEYNTNNPSPNNWNRSRESLIREWELHNLSYTVDDSKRGSSKDCDFNNKDESIKDFLKNHIS